MNSYVILFAALIITVSGSSLRAGRQGWSAPPPAPVSVEIDLNAAAAAVGAGAADATLDVLAVAVGGPNLPAEIDLSAQTSAAVGQDIDITQVAAVDLTQPGPSSSSLNVVSVDNYAVADETFTAAVSGEQSAYLASSAADSASGTGQISASASSLNEQISA